MARIKQKPLTPDALLSQVRMMMASGERASPADISRVEKLANDAERDRKEARAWIIAGLRDQVLPLKFYHPWAAYNRINQAERDGELTTIQRLNGKLMIKPSDFFDWFSTLPAEVKRAKTGGKTNEKA